MTSAQNFIIILSDNKCNININEVGGIYRLVLQSVSGMFYPIILDENDWIEFENFTLKVTKKIINMEISSLNEYLTQEYEEQCPNPKDNIFETDFQTMKTTFPEPIKNYSDRFKHIYGNITSTNGPQLLIIKCNGIPTEMRFCNQKIGETYAAMISNIVSFNLNQYSVGFPFSLVGGEYIIGAERLRNIEFSIVDIYNKPVEFINDIVWTFSLERIEDTKRVINFCTENEL